MTFKPDLHTSSGFWGQAKAKKHHDVVLPSNHTVFTGLTFRSIMTDLYHLSQADGAGDWREKEAKDLSDLVQNRITYLQVNLTHILMQSLSKTVSKLNVYIIEHEGNLSYYILLVDFQKPGGIKYPSIACTGRCLPAMALLPPVTRPWVSCYPNTSFSSPKAKSCFSLPLQPDLFRAFCWSSYSHTTQEASS